MRAITVPSPGGPDVLQWAEVPDPEPAPGEVLLDVAAAGVNRADLLQRQGHYPPPRGASPLLGLECSGTVIDPGDSGLHPGAEVCALLTGGGYAQRVAVPVGQVMPLPPGVGLDAAAGLPEVAATVLSNLSDVEVGDTVLIHGGGSGIGTFAIQYLTAIGARVIVTAGSAAKLHRCAELGAVGLINYREQDFPVEVKRLTEGRGADVILDIIGAKYLPGNVASLAVGGRLVVIGLQGGVRGELALNELLGKQGTIRARSLRYRPVEQKQRICADVVARAWPMVADGRIAPQIDRVLPIEQAADAHRLLAAGEVTGKVVLSVPASVE